MPTFSSHHTMRIKSSPLFAVPVAAATLILVLATSAPWQLAPAWATESAALEYTSEDATVGVDGEAVETLDRDELTVWIEPEPAPAAPPAAAEEPPANDTPEQQQETVQAPASGTLAPVASGASPGGIFADLNAQRAAAGLAPFTTQSGLMGVAQQWSVSQAQSATMYHNPSFSGQVAAVGCGGATENVASAMGTISPVNAWMNSPPHRANILGNSTHIGVGAATSSNGLTYYTLNFANC